MPSVQTPADTALTHNELRLIFLHELAHVRRNDVATNWLITLLQILHWFNPVLHFAFARLRADRELACDQLVLQTAHRHERHAYGQTILKLLQNISRRPALPGMVGILEGSHLMRRRITMIARFNDTPSRWPLLAIAAILTLAAVALTDAVNGQTPQSTTPPQLQPTTAEPASPTPAPISVSQTSVEPSPTNPSADKPSISPNGSFELKIANAPLGELLKMLTKQSGTNIIADWQALKAAGINEQTVLNFDAKNVTLADALSLIARQLGNNMVFQPEGKILVLTTAKTPPIAANPPAAVPGAALPAPSPDVVQAGLPAAALPVQAVKTRFALPESPANTRILIALNKPIDKVNFTDVPLREVVNFLREKSGINLIADWKALESVGVTPDTTITVSVSDVPLKEVLRLVLRAAADNLTYDIEGGVLTITTTDEADRQLLIKVYDVSNLVDTVAANTDPAVLKELELDLHRAEVQRSVGVEQYGKEHKDIAKLDRTIDALKKQMAQLQRTSGARADNRPGETAQQLAAVITATVSPGSWAESGGPGSIKTFNTKLVIATTKANHESIETLLNLLRDDPAQPAPKP